MAATCKSVYQATIFRFNCIADHLEGDFGICVISKKFGQGLSLDLKTTFLDSLRDMKGA